MTNTFAIYLLTRLTALQGLFIGISILTGCIVLFAFMYRSIELSNDYEPDVPKIARVNKIIKSNLIAFGVSIISVVFTPNTKEAMLIIAGGKTLDYVQKDTALQKIPYKATELILHKMDEYIKEDSK